MGPIGFSEASPRFWTCCDRSATHAETPLLKKLSALVVFVSLARWPAGLAAQTPVLDPHAVQPQRPTVATHAGTVAPGWIEFELGAEYDRYTDGTQGSVAPLLAKVGLAPRLQLEVQGVVVRPPGAETTGIGDSTIGVKWRLAEDASLAGDVAIVSSVKLPSGSADARTGTGTVDFNFLFISSHKLGPVAMDLNLGYTRRSGGASFVPRNAGVWTASFGGPGRGRLGWVAELFGYPALSGLVDDESIVALLAGPTIMIQEWLALDVGVIGAIAGPQPRAIYAGVTYNAGRLWK
jgi:Putative MetA-pathway of phenol degradation